MSRPILATFLIAALFGGIALVLVWYVSFGLARLPHGEIRFEQMSAPARLSYYEDGSVSISAAGEIDAFRALGFRMGRDHAWTAVLIRQTALGRLGEWFGEPVLKLDTFAHRLGFAGNARRSVANLSLDDREALSAFAQGMTLALRDESITLSPEFVLFGIEPEPWEDWHSLAVGRLVAWFSEPPIATSESDSMFWPLRSFEDDDRFFRSWLHLHGADMSAAWAYPDSAGMRLHGRLVYGATALPLFTTTSLQWPSFHMDGIGIVGTPFFPVLVGRAEARVSMLSSKREIVRIVAETDSVQPTWRHERIEDHDGDQRIVSTAHYGGGILLNTPDEAGPNDSTFTALVLRWPGLEDGADWPAWRAALLRAASPPDAASPESSTFQIVDGDGLSVNGSGVAIVGSPNFTVSSGDLVFAAGNPVARYAAWRLLAEVENLPLIEGADRSEWARENADRALSLVSDDSSFDALTLEAIDYLTNWDFRYDRSSIGASIFDGWMLHHRPSRGAFPVIEIPSDSLALAGMKLRFKTTLQATVDSMARIGGPDLARWRLEYFREGRRFFPVWSFEPLRDELPGMSRSRYEPLEIPRPGHPTTVDWQPGLDDEPANAPSHVLFSGRLGESFRLNVTPDYEIGSNFIARYVAGPPRHRSQLVKKSVDEVTLTPSR